MYSNVHCAPVLEIHDFRLNLVKIGLSQTYKIQNIFSLNPKLHSNINKIPDNFKVSLTRFGYVCIYEFADLHSITQKLPRT